MMTIWMAICNILTIIVFGTVGIVSIGALVFGSIAAVYVVRETEKEVFKK